MQCNFQRVNVSDLLRDDVHDRHTVRGAVTLVPCGEVGEDQMTSIRSFGKQARHLRRAVPVISCLRLHVLIHAVVFTHTRIRRLQRQSRGGYNTREDREQALAWVLPHEPARCSRGTREAWQRSHTYLLEYKCADQHDHVTARSHQQGPD
jgi:hypothetical protein